MFFSEYLDNEPDSADPAAERSWAMDLEDASEVFALAKSQQLESRPHFTSHCRRLCKVARLNPAIGG